MREENYKGPSPEEQAEIDAMYEAVDECTTMDELRACDVLTERSHEFACENNDRMYFVAGEDVDGDLYTLTTMSVVKAEGKTWFIVHENGEPLVLGADPEQVTFFSVKRLDADIEAGGPFVHYDPVEDRILATN
jgi:hypothetical protein